MVRECWFLGVTIKVIVCNFSKISIKQRECCEVTSTRNSEYRCIFKPIVFRIRHIEWSDLSLTKIQTNNRCTSRQNYTTFYRVVLIKIVVLIKNIKVSLRSKLIETNFYISTISSRFKFSTTIIINNCISRPIINVVGAWES